MLKPTTGNSRCKICQGVVSWMNSRAAALASRTFRTADAAARRRGWQVISMNGGLSRRYRDPRFDMLAARSGCSGRGGPE